MLPHYSPAARSVAVLHKEDDLDLMQELNTAARSAEAAHVASESYCDQQTAVVREMETCNGCLPPFTCEKHSYYFMMRPYAYPEMCPTQDENCESEDSYSEYCKAVSALGQTCSFVGQKGVLCGALRIHTDPWDD